MIPVPYGDSAARQDPAVRLRPAFAAAAAEARPRLLEVFPTWRDIPRLVSHNEAFETRMAAATSGQSVRVDFKRVFNNFSKKRLSDFNLDFTTGDLFRFSRPIDDKLALAVDWQHKSGKGIGKLFELQAGARWDQKRAVVQWPIPFFYGLGDAADWAYSTKEDLEACLDGGAQFLEALLPGLAGSLAMHMAMPEFPGAAPVSAREAYEIARPLADRLAPGLGLVGADLYPGTGRWGALVSGDGRLRAHAFWSFQFAGSGSRSAGVRIEVPFMGSPVPLYTPDASTRREPVGEN